MAHVRPLHAVAVGSREQGSRGNRWERCGDGFFSWSRACNPKAAVSAVIFLGGSNAQCEGRGEQVPEQDLGSVGGKDALTVLDHLIAKLRELLTEMFEALKRIAEGTKVGIARAIDGAKPMMEHVLAQLIEFSKNIKEKVTDAVDQAKPLADHAVKKLNHLFVKGTEIGSAAIDQTKPMVEKALAFVAGVAGVVLDVFTSQKKSVTKQSSAEEKKDQAAEESKGVEGAAWVVDEEHQELVVPAWPERYRQFLPLFVLGAICGGMLGFLLLRRTRDVEYAKIAAQKAGFGPPGNVPKGVKVTSGRAQAHPRRASPGGPLQETEMAAAVVREVLEVVRNVPQVKEALGQNMLESRLSQQKQVKAGSIKGDFGLKGDKGGAARVEVMAVKSDGNTWRCTAITLKLPNLDKPLDIPLASHPDDASKNSGASA